MAAKKSFHGHYDHDNSPDYNFRKDFGPNVREKMLKQHEDSWEKKNEQRMQRQMEEQSKKFFIGEENWRKIVQCWEDFLTEDYDDRADALFSLIEELILGEMPAQDAQE
jgi:hypothetical protein